MSYTYEPNGTCLAQIRVYKGKEYEDISIEIDTNWEKTIVIHEAIKELYKGSEIIIESTLEEPILAYEPIISLD